MVGIRKITAALAVLLALATPASAISSIPGAGTQLPAAEIPDGGNEAPPLPDEELKNRNSRPPMFLSFKLGGGQVFQTNEFVRGDRVIPFYGSGSLRFGVTSTGDRWQDIAYGMPYYGIGVYAANFGRQKDLGNPVSLYLVQGATMMPISPRVTLNYEWNLGASFGWKPYDAFTNHENVAIGSDMNVHVGLAIYAKLILSPRFDLLLGADLSHFSNGASRMPNSGMNMYSFFVEAVYNFNRKQVRDKFDPTLTPPKYERHLVSDVYLNMSSRQISVDTVGTNLPSKYLDHKFNVLGINYSLMYAPNYRYRYGLGADLVYDRSAGSWAERKKNPIDDKWYDVVHYGRFGQRLSLGMSAKGEIVLPGYTIFANLGMLLYRGYEAGNRFYQILGIKVYLKDNFFGTFGIRANHFSSAQYLFWSLGYTINHYRRKT